MRRSIEALVLDSKEQPVEGSRLHRARSLRELVVRQRSWLDARLAAQPGLNAALDRDRRHGGGLLAGALAFRLFGAMLPLALLVAVAVGYAATVDRAAPGDAAHALGIRKALAESLAQSAQLSTGTRWAVAGFALVSLIWSASSAARAIRAAHAVAWEGGVGRYGRPVHAALVLILALAGFALIWGVVGRARAELGAAGLLVAVVAIVPFFAIWLGVAGLLPHAGAPWTALIPGAVLVAVGMQIVHLGTVLFVADKVERASATYGSFGAAFTILVWLYVASRVIVASAMLNAALWRSRTGGSTEA
jgi:uncharacterized BrkB/YihY/UPF0761 family membrane protein